MSNLILIYTYIYTNEQFAIFLSPLNTHTCATIAHPSLQCNKQSAYVYVSQYNNKSNNGQVKFNFFLSKHYGQVALKICLCGKLEFN